MLPGIGIFGNGQLAKVLVPSLRAKGFRVEALWSMTIESAQITAEELQIPFWTHEMDKVLLMPNVQLIVMVCPPHLHEQITAKACGIGKHVLCDWPPALSNGEMISMLKAALNYPSLITILCHSLRFLPAFLQMRQLVSDGIIGTVKIVNVNVYGDCLKHTYNVRCDEMMGGGVVSNIGSHIIDIIQFVTKSRAKRVHATVKNLCQLTDNVCSIKRISADDFVCFQMEMDNNCFATVTINSHLYGQFSQEVFVCGTKGYLVVRGCDLSIHINKSNKEEMIYQDIDDHTDNNTLPLCAINVMPKPYRKGLFKMITALRDAFQTSPPDGCRKDLVYDNNQLLSPKETEKLFHWVKDAVRLAANFEDGKYIQSVIEAIKYSSRNKEWVRINEDDLL